ncbi:Fic family protein [Selenomonas ruminantium]|uniref:Fic family protein n=1 Tax=Selenomonas ruminantium TaxID=971 RepID=UPI0034E971BC
MIECLCVAENEALELADRKHFRCRYLNPLLKSGEICMTMPDKPQSSKQKYIETFNK